MFCMQRFVMKRRDFTMLQFTHRYVDVKQCYFVLWNPVLNYAVLSDYFVLVIRHNLKFYYVHYTPWY